VLIPDCAALHPGYELNFKQPRLRVLAAQCVRGLPVLANRARGWSGGRRQGACEAPLEAGLTDPPRAARRPRAPKARRSASRRSTGHQAVDRSGAPRSGQLSLCPTSGTPLEAPLIGQDPSRISEVLGTGIRNKKKIFASVYRHVSRARCGILHAAPQNRDPFGDELWAPAQQCSTSCRTGSGAHTTRRQVTNGVH